MLGLNSLRNCLKKMALGCLKTQLGQMIYNKTKQHANLVLKVRTWKIIWFWKLLKLTLEMMRNKVVTILCLSFTMPKTLHAGLVFIFYITECRTSVRCCKRCSWSDVEMRWFNLFCVGWCGTEINLKKYIM